jgi:pantoate--beta-alanine ligase
MPEIERIRTLKDLRSWRTVQAARGDLGFIPTMGALHSGHGSLFEESVAQNAVSLASVFVNPLQFNEGADFKRYPRTEQEDCEVLQSFGIDAVYLPSRSDMYPPGYETRVRPGPGGELYEGYHRPGHFEGMLTVVHKLFGQVQPDRAYFGQKDAQQLWLVRRMALDLDLNVEVIGCETVREDDGLAKSSRNAFLSPADRARSVVVAKALFATRNKFEQGEREIAALERCLNDVLRSEPAASIEYANLIDDRTFRPAVSADPGPLRAVVAVRIGDTRLIDNLYLGQG